MYKEYVEFFKSRQKIKVEFKTLSAKIESQIDEIRAHLNKITAKHDQMTATQDQKLEQTPLLSILNKS